MANKNFNSQTTNSLDATKSESRKGKPIADKKPKATQVINEPIGIPKGMGSGFKSKEDFINYD